MCPRFAVEATSLGHRLFIYAGQLMRRYLLGLSCVCLLQPGCRNKIPPGVTPGPTLVNFQLIEKGMTTKHVELLLGPPKTFAPMPELQPEHGMKDQPHGWRLEDGKDYQAYPYNGNNGKRLPGDKNFHYGLWEGEECAFEVFFDHAGRVSTSHCWLPHRPVQ